MMLKWKDGYSIGVKLIDEQHKHIFEIGNSAYELLKNDLCSDKYSRIVQVIEDLRQYTIYHFKCEEDHMLKINYPNYDSQKIEHDDFIKKIDSFNLDNIGQNQDQYIEDLLFLIMEWIVDHILLKDMLIRNLKEKQQ
jgi:hemerythrin